MKDLTIEEIVQLQEEYGLTELQDNINSGLAWKLEGSYGRSAMSALEQGACVLPEESHLDYYGNTVPARADVKDGHKGTLGCAQLFWQKVQDGEIELNRPDDD